MNKQVQFNQTSQFKAALCAVAFIGLFSSNFAPASAYGAESAQRGPAAQKNSQAQAAPADADKVDISDLERKYWSTKDTDFNVVQNRLYSKAGRFSVSADYGILVNDPWSNGQVYGGDIAYYPSDRWGVEASYEYINCQDNNATQKLISAKGARPDNNRLNGYFGVSAVWVPFYAKMSVMNASIMYFDMQFSLGAGLQSYAQQIDTGANTKQSPAVELDVSQHFFVTKNLAVRIDLKNRWYSEEVVYFSTTSAQLAGTRVISNNVSNATILTAGLTFLF
jgi:outer membrane beta-barrel protein